MIVVLGVLVEVLQVITYFSQSLRHDLRCFYYRSQVQLQVSLHPNFSLLLVGPFSDMS